MRRNKLILGVEYKLKGRRAAEADVDTTGIACTKQCLARAAILRSTVLCVCVCVCVCACVCGLGLA